MDKRILCKIPPHLKKAAKMNIDDYLGQLEAEIENKN